jgi:hypothetical protein
MDFLYLQNETLRIQFERHTGALTGLTALPTGWKILDRPDLGLSFCLLVPLRDQKDWHAPADRPRNNHVEGEKQSLSSYTIDPGGRAVHFTWDHVISEKAGVLPIKVSLEVCLDGSRVIFTPTIENGSEFTVENVFCPYLGDVQHPEGCEFLKTFSYQYQTAQEWSLWPTYNNLRGYFGVDYPTQVAAWGASTGSPMAPFMLLRSENQGLYAGVWSPEGTDPDSELVAWHSELRPGYGSSIDWRVSGGKPTTGAVPRSHIRFAAVHVPYIQPGEKRTLTPVMLQAFQGGWQNGVDIYKSWRNGWMKPAPLPGWAAQPHAWQQIHINSPEDELRIPFKDLPKVGEECAKHGVKAIQLVGWNDGGQDQGNPSHDPDPRLGTFAELKEAIAKIHAMGVKVILFSKFTWADRATPRFREDLVRLAIKDPFGDYQVHNGYQYQTLTQLLDINTKRLVPMCFLSEEYLKICDEEFKKTVELGAAGILFDECLHHANALLCFDPGHGHRYGAPVYANDRKLIENFEKISNLVDADFLYAGEACYDWEMQVYQVSYHRSENKQHIPLSRYMLPEAQFMTAVTGFNDRSMVNQCLMYRYIISYEPYNFKGHLDDFPLTIEYGKKMDALRTELREYFWDGEFRDTLGARVTCDSKPHHPYSVFVSRKTGKTGLVICNYDEAQAVTVQAELENGKLLERYRLVDDPEWKDAGQGIVIPACSAAVVI